MKRRQFLKHMGKGGLTACVLQVKLPILISIGADTAHAQVAYDLIIDGYSVYDGAKLGRAGTLLATQIVALQPISNIPYKQDSHGHTFDLSKSDLEALLQGQPVSKETSVMQNHKHEVRINPANRANPSQQGVSVPTNTGTNPPDPQPSPQPNIPQPSPQPNNPQPNNPPTGTTARGAADQHCTECHHRGAEIPLDMTGSVSQEDLQMAEQRMRATGDDRMPPGFRDPLSAEQIQAVLNSLK